MDGNALPCRACFVNEYTERKRNKNWPDHPFMLILQEHVCYKPQKHRSAQPAQPQMRDDLANALIQNWARMCPSAIRKLIRSFTCMCTVVFDA